jgi:hypothetical protein
MTHRKPEAAAVPVPGVGLAADFRTPPDRKPPS